MVSYIGYKSRQVKGTVKSDQTTQRDVELNPAVLEGDLIEAIGDRVTSAYISPVSAFGTRVTELARIPTVGSQI